MTKQPTPGPDQDADLSAEIQAVFGESVRTQRTSAGMTQADLAKLTGITQEEISRIENGRVNLTIRKMTRLAKVLDGNLGKMLGDALNGLSRS